MKISLTIVLSVLAITGLGIGVRDWLFIDASKTSNGLVSRPPAQSRAKLSKGSSSPSGRLVSTLKSGAELTSPQGRKSEEVAGPSSANLELSDPNEVIGRPFPLSASVRHHCESSLPNVCVYGFNGLALMEQEPRDPVWAPTMEAKIADSVAVEASNASLRTVECRKSICVYEVATTYGSYTGPSYEFMAANNVLRGNLTRGIAAWMHGFEIDSNGVHIKVEVTFLVRR